MMEAVDFAETGQGVAQATADGISSKEGDVTQAAENAMDGANAYIDGLPERAHVWGADFGDGLASGINSRRNIIGEAASGLADIITSFLHFSVPDEGPLTTYESWMPDFMEGMAKGIKNNKYKVTDQIKGLASEMQLDINPGSIGNTTIVMNNAKLDRLCELAEQYFPQFGNIQLDGKNLTKSVSNNMAFNRGLLR